MSIQVTACLNPFSTERSEFTFEQGISVSDIIKKLDALHAVNTGWRVLIDDEIVTDFSRVPKDGQHVYVKLVPEGDTQSTGTGMKIGGGLAVLGGIIAIATLGWTGVGGVLGATLIGAGISCFAGGAVLYNTDIPSISNKKQESPEQDPSIRGSQNQMRPYGVVPTLLGRRRIYTDLASKSYTWAENGAVYLYQLFCVGQKDMEIFHGQDKDHPNSIKIDETLITDYSETGDIDKILAGEDSLIDLRIHQDGTMPELYDRCVHEEQINAILKHETDEGIDGSIIRTTPDGTEEINVDVFFYNGLAKYNDEGKLVDTSVAIGAWYKKADEPDSAYRSMGKFSSGTSAFSVVTWLYEASIPATEKINKTTLWNHYEDWSKKSGTDGVSPNPLLKSLYAVKIILSLPVLDGLKITSYKVMFRVTAASTSAVSGETIITGNKLETQRHSLSIIGLESASYTVKISRITADSTDSKVIDAVYVGSIRAAKNENPVRSERASQLTIVELKIKASEKLNQVVKQLNFIAESKLPVYSGKGNGSSQWSYAQSRNPASAAVYAMQGGFAQQKLSDSAIDWTTFEKLYTWCAVHQYECNAYITESMTISSLLNAIASTCRAEIVRLNGKITVIQDITRDSFVQVFTPRNSHDYSENIALSDVPDAMNLNFNDSENGYAQGQVRIYNTPSGNYAGVPETTQDVELWGVTNSEQARKLGMYKYAVTNHRAFIHRFSVDFEYLMCTKGDWIKYAGDIALAGITQGRIQEVIKNTTGLVIGVMCDEEIPMVSGKSYGVRVRKSTGEASIFYLQTTISENPRMVFFQTPTTEELAPHSGDLFTFGEAKGANLEDSIDLIITDIQCGENLSADLICVEYSPEIFGVDNPDFVLPDFENKISDVEGTRNIIDAGQITPEWQTFFTYHDGEKFPEPATGDGTNDGWHTSPTSESKWMSSKTAKNIFEGTWSAPSRKKGDKGEKGDSGDMGADGGSLVIYAEQMAATFSIDNEGKVEETELYVPVHVLFNGIELPFEIRELEEKDGLTLEEYYAGNSHGVKVTTTKDYLLTEGTFNIPIVYSEVTEINVYGDRGGNYAFGTASETTAYGNLVIDEDSVSYYNLVFSYDVSDLSRYRGAKDSISGFLAPGAEGVHRGDWFTWTGDTTSETYNGTEVTFRAGSVYKWNGDYWEKDSDQSHMMTAFSDVMSVAKEKLEANNEKITELLERLTKNEAYLSRLNNEKLGELLAQNEKLQTNLAEKEKFLTTLNSEKFGELLAQNEKLDTELANAENFYSTLAENKDFATLIVGVLVADKALINMIVASEGFFESITAVEGFYTNVTAVDGFFESVTAVNAFFDKVVATEGFFESVTATSGFFDSITATKGFFESITALNGFFESVTATEGFFENISAVNGFFEALTATTGFFENIVATQGFIEKFASFYVTANQLSVLETKASAAATAAGDAATAANDAATSAGNAEIFASDAQSAASAAATSASSAASSAARAASDAATVATESVRTILEDYAKKEETMSEYEPVFFRTNNGKQAVPTAPAKDSDVLSTDTADKWTTAQTSATYTYTYVCYRYKKADTEAYSYTSVSCEAATLIKDGKIITSLIDADDIFTKQLTLKSGGAIQSSNYDGGIICGDSGEATKGFRIESDGDVFFSNGTFKGHIEAESGKFTGELNATGGTLKDLTIEATITLKSGGIIQSADFSESNGKGLKISCETNTAWQQFAFLRTKQISHTKDRNYVIVPPLLLSSGETLRNGKPFDIVIGKPDSHPFFMYTSTEGKTQQITKSNLQSMFLEQIYAVYGASAQAVSIRCSGYVAVTDVECSSVSSQTFIPSYLYIYYDSSTKKFTEMTFYGINLVTHKMTLSVEDTMYGVLYF
ncbi:MAG: hypothetical protein IJ558_04865 [Treponema sp.]|nr:hypothetical protein [Treponema sp.]